MVNARGSRTRTGRLIALVTSVTIAMASLVALVGVAPAGAADSTTITWTGGQPGNGTGGGALSPQPKVTGNSAIDNTTSVHLALTGGTAGAILTCDQASNTTPLVSGVTAFTGCKVDKAGTGYTLVATTIPALNSPKLATRSTSWSAPRSSWALPRSRAAACPART